MQIDLHHVVKQYGEVVAVAGVSLTAEAGELLAIVGPSGCGKTTLLRLIAGFIHPDRGRVLIGGKDMHRIPPERRSVGIVFQNYALFPHMNVFDNIAYGLKQQKKSRGERKTTVEELLGIVGLLGYEKRRPHELSAGQQQRVALARALAPRPSVLLLDEPLSALDAFLREQLRQEIRRIQHRFGITTVMVTHDQDEALAIADRVAVMYEGNLEQVAGPWTLYAEPETAFVASFIGRSNRLAGRVTVDGADLSGLGRVPDRFLPSHVGVGHVHAIVRPEDIQVVSTCDTDGAIHISQARASAAQDGFHVTMELSDVVFGGDHCLSTLTSRDLALRAFTPGNTYPFLRKKIGSALDVFIPFASLRWVRSDLPASGAEK